MSKRLSKVPLCLAFVALFVFQGLNLDSDPSPLKRLGDFGDEGYWQHNSRCEVLFGTFVPDELNQAFIGAPLFTAFQWLSFSLFGVSIFTARLISLVSLWLVLLMLYGLMRQAFSAGQAMLAVVMLGLMHEMLMHAKWSTPILPEMCFLTAILFFWELGRKGSPGWMLLSGGCLIGAVATKLSSLYFVLAIVLFLLGAWGVRKEVDGKRLLLFVAGVALGTVALASFYLSNYAQLLSFAQTIGKANVSGHQSGWEIASRFVTIPLHWAFVLPGVCVLAMLSSLWFFEQIVTAIRHGFRWAVCHVSTAEYYSLCWLVGTLSELAISPQRPDRRFVMFYVPMTILATSFALRQFAGWDTNREDGIVPRSKVGRIVLWVLSTCLWWRYVRKAIALISTRLFLADAASLHWSVSCIAIAVCATIAAMFFLFRKPREAVAGFLGIFFAVSLTLDGLWYLRPTYTLRDESRALACDATNGLYLVGEWSHELALENRTVPIWSPWLPEIPMNRWFADGIDRYDYLMIVTDEFDGTPGDAVFSKRACEIVGTGSEPHGPPATKTVSGEAFVPAIPQAPTVATLPPERLKEIQEIKICPILFGDGYKFRAKIYLVRSASRPSTESGKRQSLSSPASP